MATAIAVTATAAGAYKQAHTQGNLPNSWQPSIFLFVLGSALGFVVGPAVVGLPTNQTESRSGINTLFYSEAIVCVVPPQHARPNNLFLTCAFALQCSFMSDWNHRLFP